MMMMALENVSFRLILCCVTYRQPLQCKVNFVWSSIILTRLQIWQTWSSTLEVWENWNIGDLKVWEIWSRRLEVWENWNIGRFEVGVLMYWGNVGVLKYVRLEVCETWSMGDLKYGRLEIWETWRMGDLKYGISEVWETWSMGDLK